MAHPRRRSRWERAGGGENGPFAWATGWTVALPQPFVLLRLDDDDSAGLGDRHQGRDLLGMTSRVQGDAAQRQRVARGGGLVERRFDLLSVFRCVRIDEAQEVLELQDSLARLRKVDALLKRELEVSSAQADIQSPSSEELTNDHRESFLREQLRAIQSELGEADPRTEEFDEYRLKVEEANLPEEAREDESTGGSSGIMEVIKELKLPF